MVMERGTCINYSGCQKAKDNKIQIFSKSNPICDECGSELRPAKDSSGKWKSNAGIAIAAISVVGLVAGGGYGIYQYSQSNDVLPPQQVEAKPDAPVISCPSGNVEDFLRTFPSPDQWVKGAEACLAQANAGSGDSYWIRFEIKNGEVLAFNPHGDKVTGFSVTDIEAWKKVIAKYRMLSAINNHYNASANPVKINLLQGNGLHAINEHLDFSFDPNSDWRYFMLFDLAGTGELQFLYPLQGQGDPPALSKIPYTLALNVLPPTGEDDLIAVFCSKPQDKAVALLNGHNGGIAPASESFMDSLDKDCQIGIYSFFSGINSDENPI
jgi:hypothetical protein